MSTAVKISRGAAVGLAVGMLITGSVNTLSTKWADNTYSSGRFPNSYAQFQHPFVQVSTCGQARPDCAGRAALLRVAQSARRC